MTHSTTERIVVYTLAAVLVVVGAGVALAAWGPDGAANDVSSVLMAAVAAIGGVPAVGVAARKATGAAAAWKGNGTATDDGRGGRGDA